MRERAGVQELFAPGDLPWDPKEPAGLMSLVGKSPLAGLWAPQQLVWSNLANDWALPPKDAGEIDLSKVESKMPNPDPYAFINAAQKLLFESLGKPCPKCGEHYSITHPYGICKPSDPT